MGSLGTHKQYLQQNNFQNLDEYDEQVLNDNVTLPVSTASQQFANGWNFPGIGEQVDRLEAALNRTRTTGGISRIFKSLREQEAVVNRELAQNNPNNDRNALLTYRRRIRQLLNRIRSME